MRRTFFAPPLTTTWPSVTCPSPPSATLEPRRTERMVVPWNSAGMELRPLILRRVPANSSPAGDPSEPRCQCHRRTDDDDRANDHRTRGQIGDDGQEQPQGVTQCAYAVRLEKPVLSRVKGGERRHDKRGEDEKQS